MEDFSQVYTRVVPHPGDYFQLGIGLYFQVHFPDDWPEAEKYDFNWHQLENEPDPFQNITF